MIECAICESAQFLQIESRVRFEGGETVTEVREKYLCTWCGRTGKLEIEDGVKTVTGGMRETTERPRVKV